MSRGAYSNAQPNWRHVSKSPAELTLWLAQSTASGMVPWFHWLGGSPEDTRWREVGHSFFDWLAANEAHFRNRHRLADLAVLYPQRTVAFYSRPNSSRAALSRCPDRLSPRLYYALLEGRFFFDFVHEGNSIRRPCGNTARSWFRMPPTLVMLSATPFDNTSRRRLPPRHLLKLLATRSG